MLRARVLRQFAIITSLALATGAAFAQPDPSGIEFRTIGAPGNPGYNGPDPWGMATGRGGVNYEYRLGRTEITTGQFLEFLNTFKMRPDFVPNSIMPSPSIWGAGLDPNYNGPGERYILQNQPQAAMRPVYGMTWRVAAMYTNWLHNGKSSELSAYQNGAYDTSTFGYANGRFTDQRTHNPGARYWIPTYDEWLKAAHYDPNHTGLNGWRMYPNGTDEPLIYGPPPSFGGDGTAQSNSSFRFNDGSHYAIPLMSYPTVQSPWGLLDVSGSGLEWTEGIVTSSNRDYRMAMGSYIGGTVEGADEADRAWSFSTNDPGSGGTPWAFRIATSVPSPGIAMMIAAVSLGTAFRRTRRDASAV